MQAYMTCIEIHVNPGVCDHAKWSAVKQFEDYCAIILINLEESSKKMMFRGRGNPEKGRVKE